MIKNINAAQDSSNIDVIQRGIEAASRLELSTKRKELVERQNRMAEYVTDGAMKSIEVEYVRMVGRKLFFDRL